MNIDNEVRRLFTAGATYSEVAAMLGLTKGVVAGKCRRMGLVREGSNRVGKWKGKPVISAEEQAERIQDQRDLDMLSDVRDGHSIRETARHWGVSFNYLQAIAKAAKEAA